MNAASRAGATALAAAALACASLPAAFPFTPPQPQPTPEEGAWARARDRFTASAKLYDGLSARAFVSAVYQAPDVRETRVARVAVWKNLTAKERDAMATVEHDEAAQFDDFLVALFTTDRADNDLDASRSVWRLVVAVPGEGEVEPVKVEGVRTDATLRTLYPSIGDFDQVYRVRFPRWQAGPLADRRFVLRMASARGRLDLPFPAGAAARK